VRKQQWKKDGVSIELSGIDAWLAQREATVPTLRPGCAKQIIWADQPETQTDVAVLFIHGFSATKEELRPLPDLVARDLGANLHFTRLKGHGEDPEAFGAATCAQWMADVAEALAIAQTIGKDVIIIGCSTGCTLATIAMAQGAQVKGMVHVSPNFGLRHPVAQTLLQLPGVRHYGHLIAGRTRSFPVLNDAHAAYWTTSYPISAVYTMADAVRAAKACDIEGIKVPAFFAINPDDQVISPKAAARIMKAWGGPVTHLPLVQGADDDHMGHVMAGDVFSPNQTTPLAARISDWARKI